MSLQKDIIELLNAGVINQETASTIRDYYESKKDNSGSKLFIVFGILGAILVGLGIILILAHNWDELTKSTKTFLAFVPLLIGQILVGYSILKKENNIAWKESSSAFLFIAIGACISLISQIYHISGDISTFILTWSILGLPLIYLMRSSISSLLYLIGITAYAGTKGYAYPEAEPYLFWLLFMLVLPHYYYLFKNKPHSNFLTFHNWVIPIVLTYSLGTLALEHTQFMFIAYFALFGIFYNLSNSIFFGEENFLNQGYKIIGSIGTLALLIILSFDNFWVDLKVSDFILKEILIAPELIASTILIIISSILLFRNSMYKSIFEINPISVIYLVFVVVFVLGMFTTISQALINLIVFALGILTVREGAKTNHLGVLNYGLLIIVILTVSRFFDSDISFVLRGVMFVLVGAGFFATNIWMIRKRKNEK